MGQLSSTDPSSVANAARCFATCLGGSSQSALRTYLLTQTAGIATPPCITPSAPLSSAGAKSIGPTSFRIVWSQPSNTGSLITSYTIKWGTASGVYPNSVTVPVTPKVYDLTGLTSGTQYFWVVVANSFTGCSSANSNEGTATTTGAAPSNGLLASLTSYWKADDVASPATDSIGANPLTLASATTGTVNGIINKGFDVHLGSSQASHAAAGGSAFDPLNGSFSISLWVSSTAWNGGAATTIILNNGNPASNLSTGPYQIYLDNVAQKLICSMFDNAVTQFNLNVTGAYPTNNVFHHVVFTFDTSIKKFSVYYDGVFVTSATTGNASIYQGVGTTFIIGPGAGNSSLANLTIDEMGMWQKALSQTDVTNLYNGGAALPLASFGP